MSLSILAIDGNISHDASVTVIRDGEIFAIESERLDRVKKSCGHDYRIEQTPNGPVYKVGNAGSFTQPIEYCLKLAGIRQVDYIIHTQSYKFVRFLELEKYLAPGGRIQHFPSHHLAHACSAFYYSDFEEAAVLVVDGSGPEAGSRFNLLQSLYYFDGERIKVIKRTFANEKHQLGIGLNYYCHTHLLGMEEGSIMGLSSYGDHTQYPQNMLYNLNGDIFLNPDNIPHPVSTSTAEVTETSLFPFYGITDKAAVRDAKRDIENSFLANVAAKLQHETEERMIELAQELYDVTQAKNICLAGGVTLNSVANNKILERTPFENIFIQPGAHDAGITLGLALFAHHHTHREPRKRRPNVFLGKAYSNDEILETLHRYDHLVQAEKHEDIYSVAADIIAKKKVIAWFQGRLEFGPRALGHRSIVAHPGSIQVRDRVNDIKRRERWRPLAPAILDTELDQYFDMINHNPYMLLVARVKDAAREVAPAIVHVDGTARPQSVNRHDNPVFHRLIRAFHKRTGIPIVINTSLNSKGEPLIEHPEQAIFFLLNSGVDALVIGDYVVQKRESSSKLASIGVQVERQEEPQSPIDCARCLAQLNGSVDELHLKSLDFFKGSFNAVLEVSLGNTRRTLDLGIDVHENSVTRVLNNRKKATLPDKFMPLIGPFVEAFERYLAEES